MASGAIETLKKQTGLIQKQPQTFAQLLDSMKGQIQMALPRHLSAERMIRIALTCWRMNPKLAECDPQSIIASVMLASQLGLEPGVMGQCYLVPYKNKAAQKHFCQLIPGWMGILDLVNRTGKASAWTGAVYKGDEFDWALGDRPHVTHKPCGNDDPKDLTHVWSVARTKASDWPVIEVWPIEKVWKHRNKINKVGESHYSYQWPEMYARKVPLLQVLKYVPRSVELATALSLDEIAETGGRQMSMKEAASMIIEGEPAAISGPAAEENPFDQQETQQANPEKKLDEVCGNCGGKNGTHDAECKHAKKDEKPKHSPEWTRRNAALWATATELGVPHADVQQFAYERYKIDSCSKMTAEQIDETLAWVKDVAKGEF